MHDAKLNLVAVVLIVIALRPIDELLKELGALCELIFRPGRSEGDIVRDAHPRFRRRARALFRVALLACRDAILVACGAAPTVGHYVFDRQHCRTTIVYAAVSAGVPVAGEERGA